MSGKTTTMKAVIAEYNKKNEKKQVNVISVESTVKRTFGFDYGYIKIELVDSSRVYQIFTCTGQDFYKATRPGVLLGAGVIIFVVDSREKQLDFNKKSWSELVDQLIKLSKSSNKAKAKFLKKTDKGGFVFKIPIVVALNKYDDPGNKLTIQDIKDNFRGIELFEHVEFFTTIATKGVNIIECFETALSLPN